MSGRSNSKALEIAKQLGFSTKQDAKWSFEWIDQFVSFLTKRGDEAMGNFLRRLILQENLHPDDKHIQYRQQNESELIIHGKSYGIEFKPFFDDITVTRKETHQQEDAQVKSLHKNEKERKKAIRELIENAESDYSILYQLLNSRKKKEFLSQQTLEDISKLAFRLGLKRKKGGDINYYIEIIMPGLKDLLQEFEITPGA
jgi:hypothetical protein